MEVKVIKVEARKKACNQANLPFSALCKPPYIFNYSRTPENHRNWKCMKTQHHSHKYNEKCIINIIILIKWILRKALLHSSQIPWKKCYSSSKNMSREKRSERCGNGKNTSNYIENMIILCRFLCFCFIKLFCRYISHATHAQLRKKSRTMEMVR